MRRMRDSAYQHAAGPSTVPEEPSGLPLPSTSSSGRGHRPVKTEHQPRSFSLLKTALANRIQPKHASPTKPPPNGSTNNAHPNGADPHYSAPLPRTARSPQEMNTSLLRNAAWYRDSDGRTGYRPKELQGSRLVQGSEIKPLRRTTSSGSSQNSVKLPPPAADRSPTEEKSALIEDPRSRVVRTTSENSVTVPYLERRNSSNSDSSNRSQVPKSVTFCDKEIEGKDDEDEIENDLPPECAIPYLRWPTSFLRPIVPDELRSSPSLNLDLVYDASREKPESVSPEEWRMLQSMYVPDKEITPEKKSLPENSAVIRPFSSSDDRPTAKRKVESPLATHSMQRQVSPLGSREALASVQSSPKSSHSYLPGNTQNGHDPQPSSGGTLSQRVDSIAKSENYGVSRVGSPQSARGYQPNDTVRRPALKVGSPLGGQRFYAPENMTYNNQTGLPQTIGAHPPLLTTRQSSLPERASRSTVAVTAFDLRKKADSAENLQSTLLSRPTASIQPTNSLPNSPSRIIRPNGTFKRSVPVQEVRPVQAKAPANSTTTLTPEDGRNGVCATAPCSSGVMDSRIENGARSASASPRRHPSPSKLSHQHVDSVAILHPSVPLQKRPADLPAPKSSLPRASRPLKPNGLPTPTRSTLPKSSNQLKSPNDLATSFYDNVDMDKEQAVVQQKFLKQYGGARAPIASPEEPQTISLKRKDSCESAFSTDSRESVVSAASFRNEARTRRYFNY